MVKMNFRNLLPGKLESFIEHYGKRGEYYKGNIWDTRFGIWALAWDTYWAKQNADILESKKEKHETKNM